MPYINRHTALFFISSSLLPILYVINIWRSKAVSTPSRPSTPILPIQSQNTPSPPYLIKHVNHVIMFISYKAISSPLVAAVASAVAVAVASAAAVVPLAGAGLEVAVGATVAIRTTSDLTHF